MLLHRFFPPSFQFFRLSSQRTMSSSTSTALLDQLRSLATCEISDALTKLKSSSGGHIPDLNSYGKRLADGERIAGEVYTVKMVDSSDQDAPKLAEHFVGLMRGNSRRVKDVKNASLGGLLAAGLAYKSVKGVFIDGRCRDLAEIRSLDLPVFAKGHSTLGQSPFTRPSAVQVPLRISYPDWPEIVVNPNDVLVADEDGVVVIPKELVGEVVEAAKEGRRVDELCMQDIKAGKGVKETFAKHRGNTKKH